MDANDDDARFTSTNGAPCEAWEKRNSKKLVERGISSEAPFVRCLLENKKPTRLDYAINLIKSCGVSWGKEIGEWRERGMGINEKGNRKKRKFNALSNPPWRNK